MNKQKQTFTDPQTGEEIESTALARWGAGLVVGLVLGLVFGLIFRLVAGLLIGPVFGLVGGSILWVFGILLASVLALFAWRDTFRRDSLMGSVHDGIARQQHLRRQRILRRQEFSHVPDGALSRARPSGEPEPTSVSLSRAEAPEEEPPRLAAGVDAVAEEEQTVTRSVV
jgi:hypothetical protein